MGIPRHYSLELPDRCISLLDQLWPVVEKANDGAGYGGPLTTTFLLALATPTVVLPVERLLQWSVAESLADDRPKDAELSARARSVMGHDVLFGHCPFFRPEDGWAYTYTSVRLNLADGLPDNIAKALSLREAEMAAAQLGANDAIRALRNALAHGVIAYLNSNGHAAINEPAAMFAFVGEDRQLRNFRGLHILRISETGFRSFLHRWVDWLNRTGVSSALAA